MVEWNSLENCRAGNGAVGSNPTPSAKKIIMENIWLYTLSTLAQVMATIIALFGVFVVVKLNETRKKIFRIRNEDFIPFLVKKSHQISLEENKFFQKYNLSKDKESYSNWNDEKLNKIFKEIITLKHSIIQVENRMITKETSQYFSRLINSKNNTIKRLKKTLIFCTILVIISLFLLASPFSIFNLNQKELNLYLLLPLICFSFFTIGYISQSIYQISKE